MPEDYKNLPFDEDIDFFKQKVPLPTEKWNDLWEGMHSRAFVVAGAMKNDILSDFHEAIGKALKDGLTIEDFRKDFDNIVSKTGWDYKGGRGWRSGVIFNTNLRTAYASGHYKRMTEVRKDRPFWRYVSVLDSRTRPEHRAWNDTVLPSDDPWWNTHYPPNGWGCRCTVVSHSARELERDGLKVSERPEGGTYEWTNKSTGEVMDIPEGVDPGWAYNPGKTAWGESEASRRMEDKGPWIDIDPRVPSAYGRPEKITPDEAKAALGITARTEKDLREALRRAIGGNEVSIKDPAGETVMVTQAIVNHILKDKKRWDGREAYFPFIRELIEDPYEIWISFARSEASGRVGIRRKYVKQVQVDKNTVLGLYAEFRNGQWVSGSVFRGGATGAGNLRRGRLLYGR